MADPTNYVARNLLRFFVPEHGSWVFVWCHDDGAWDRDKRMCYQVTSSPGGFNPQDGQFITATTSSGTEPKYVYGVPTRIYGFGGSLKVEYYDLGSALGCPRQTSADTSPTPIDGKTSTETGAYLDGNFTPGGGLHPIKWTRKSFDGAHTPFGAVLEVEDVKNVTKGSGVSGFNAPSGTLVVALERDGAGNVITDDKGNPKFQKINPERGDVAQNFKIGYLAMQFVENFFGLGVHGWTTGSSSMFTLNIGGTTIIIPSPLPPTPTPPGPTPPTPPPPVVPPIPTLPDLGNCSLDVAFKSVHTETLQVKQNCTGNEGIEANYHALSVNANGGKYSYITAELVSIENAEKSANLQSTSLVLADATQNVELSTNQFLMSNGDNKYTMIKGGYVYGAGDSSSFELDSAGTLQLANASGQIGLDPSTGLAISDNGGGGAILSATSLNISGSGGGVIQIESSAVAGKIMSIRSIQVCVDGTQKTAMVLMTDPE